MAWVNAFGVRVMLSRAPVLGFQGLAAPSGYLGQPEGAFISIRQRQSQTRLNVYPMNRAKYLAEGIGQTQTTVWQFVVF